MDPDPDPDPYLWLVDPDPEPGGKKTRGSGSGTLQFYLGWPIVPSYMSPSIWAQMRGDGGGGFAGSQPMSTAVQHRSPIKLWRSNSIFNLFNISYLLMRSEKNLIFFIIFLRSFWDCEPAVLCGGWAGHAGQWRQVRATRRLRREPLWRHRPATQVTSLTLSELLLCHYLLGQLGDWTH